MMFYPVVAFEECTLGGWPTSAFLITYDVIADTDNLVLLETRLEKIYG